MTVRRLKRGRDFDISKWKADKKAVPPEVWEIYGTFSIADNNGYLYGSLPKGRRPPHLKGRSVAIAKLVWLIHNPGYRFAPCERVMYLNKDTKDNRITNLMVRSV